MTEISCLALIVLHYFSVYITYIGQSSKAYGDDNNLEDLATL